MESQCSQKKGGVMRAPDAQLLKNIFFLAFKAAQLVAEGKDQAPQLWWKVPNTGSEQVEGPFFEIPSHARSHKGLFWVSGVAADQEDLYPQDELEYWVKDPRNAEDVVRFCNEFDHDERIHTNVHEVTFVPHDEIVYMNIPGG